MQRGGNVTLCVQNTPNVHVIFALNVKNQIWETLYRPELQTWQVKIHGVTRRSCRRMGADMTERRFKRIDETQGDLDSTLFEIMLDRSIDVPVCCIARDDRFRLHLPARLRTLRRRESK